VKIKLNEEQSRKMIEILMPDLVRIAKKRKAEQLAEKQTKKK